MKVLLVNTYDSGGAGTACVRLHNALLKHGVSSHLLTMHKTRTDIPFHYSYEDMSGAEPTNILNRLNSLTIGNREIDTTTIKNISQSASQFTDVFSSIYSDCRIEDIPDIGSYDVINLHWTSRFLNWPSFFVSKIIKKVVWTLHDMAPFTGGYHYSNGFEGYKNDDALPHFLRQTAEPNLSKMLLAEKQAILNASTIPVAIVSPSKWLLQCSQQSTLFNKKSHHHIFNCVPEEFKVSDSATLASRVNITKGTKVILFVSDAKKSYRKGFHFIERLIDELPASQFTFINVGGELACHKSNVINLGRIADQNELAEAYILADRVVVPSLEDNSPNVVIESLVCGTPVVGFSIGGMTDFVTDNKCVYLSDDVSFQGLKKTLLDSLLSDASAVNNESLTPARKRYSEDEQAKSYLEVFTE
ncbi:glycosyltransferase [Salinimonas marina]|uniref:Glycosyltransferase n=1 Tax=Salinimonas marina TaxID=2785918 RepID=A0A7S9HC65_9ALTE|nr:glycosyltransferase [Salinimonas marina]QPG04956.1 glycosyltransferase [Salinimonas marina]